jgi:protein SCO1/2
MNKWVWMGLGVAISLVVIFVLASVRPYSLHGAEINPAQPAPEIRLPAADGQIFDLNEQKGNIVLLFFGYTNCPDVCPATLSEMRKLFENLGENSEDVRVVFVTVDPERDTPERLKNYVNAFNPDFIGLTAPLAELEPVYTSYGVYREVQETGSASGYLVAHTSRTYLVDKNGKLRLTFPFGTLLEDIEADVKYLLKEKME